MSGTEFQYPDLSWKEPTGIMANLVANSGDNKGQLTTLDYYVLLFLPIGKSASTHWKQCF